MFKSKDKDREKDRSRPMAAKGNNINSVIGEGSAFEGRFYINGSLKIDGKFEGDIFTDGELIVGEKGKVKTNIKARRATISGTVIGNIEADEEVKLLPTSKVLGDITAPVVIIEKGVIFKGRLNITSGMKKDIEKYVEDSFKSGVKLPEEEG